MRKYFTYKTASMNDKKQEHKSVKERFTINENQNIHVISSGGAKLASTFLVIMQIIMNTTGIRYLDHTGICCCMHQQSGEWQ